jgi:hypothetical protein
VREAAEPRGKALDVSPQGFAVRTLAQEYGGGSGAFAVQGDTVVFSNYSDQRLYMQTIGGKFQRSYCHGLLACVATTTIEACCWYFFLIGTEACC